MQHQEAARPGDERFAQHWERAAKGSAEEIADLLNLYRPYLKSLASRELNPALRMKEGSSDLVQQTIIDGQAGFLNCQAATVASLRLWLRQILMNNLRDARRHFLSQRRDISKECSLHDPVSIVNALSVVNAKFNSPVQAAIDREHRELVRDTLSKLDHETREILLLRYREGQGYREIARITGCSVATVHYRVQRAIDLLKRVINDSNESCQ